MVNRLPLLIGFVVAALLAWGYATSVDSAFFGAALDGANQLFRPGPMIALGIIYQITRLPLKTLDSALVFV